jgi:hypothetical protein
MVFREFHRPVRSSISIWSPYMRAFQRPSVSSDEPTAVPTSPRMSDSTPQTNRFLDFTMPVSFAGGNAGSAWFSPSQG